MYVSDDCGLVIHAMFIMIVYITENQRKNEIL